MRKKYMTGVIIAVLVLTCNQIFIQYWLQKKTHDARVINIAGRQRMLSQRINLELYKMNNHHTDASVVNDLERQWLKAHKALLYGDVELGITGTDDPKSKEMLNNLTLQMEKVVKEIHTNAYMSDSNLVRISNELNSFLDKMDLAVKLLEDSANRKLTFIIIIEIVLALISILVIISEVVFIYRPISNKLQEQLEAVKKSEQELKDRNFKLRRIAEIQSHKLRKPLANILGLIHLINFDDRGEYNDLYLEKLKKSAEELDEIIAIIVEHSKTVNDE